MMLLLMYPAMKPYLKGFHLSLESWRQGRDNDGWKIPKPKKTMTEAGAEERSVGGELSHHGPGGMEEIKMDLLTRTATSEDDRGAGPMSGITRAIPRFKEDLKSILDLASGDKPVMRCVCSRRMLTAFYGFGDALSAGFGSTMMRPRGIHGRFGLWGKDEEDKSSNYRELRNLVETVEEEAREGYLKDSELWLFIDNSTAESCFLKGGSTSKLLHELILRLKKAEIQHGFILHMVHVAWTRMIEQGTENGLSQGSFLEGVLAGKDMLSFVNLSLSAIQWFPKVLDYIQSWLAPLVGEGKLLKEEEWFAE